MSVLASPFVLYAGIVLGAIGVALALPRRGLSPQALGGLIAGVGLGVALLALGMRGGGSGPGVYFYVFTAIALGSALRVISHPRPVYAALYFILTILSSAGFYLLLSSEFMAFALIIIYAGAILITYLFVIMLATETPTAEEVDALSDYDRYSREPIASVIAGFVLLAALTGLFTRGLAEPPAARNADVAAMAAQLPERARPALVEAYGLPPEAEVVGAGETAGSVVVRFPNGWGGSDQRVLLRALGPDETMEFPVPAGVAIENIEQIGLTLVGAHPLGLELAGVILLMAMLGAVVLARKQIQIEEFLKFEAAHAGGLVPGGTGARGKGAAS